MSNPVLQLEGIERTFIQAGEKLPILRHCSFEISAGELVALIGPSGSGKSTLLHIAGLLERPDAGIVRLAGKPATSLDDAGRTALRRQTIGFVYQFHHLLPEFSALENVIIPQMIAGIEKSIARRRALELLEMVDLTKRADHRPAQLSGGEQQRVALVRALANNPKILIADEPTGNLDPQTAANVFDVLTMLVRTQKLALLMATHDHALAHGMKRILQISNGALVPVKIES
jgi:lipoprotein-releasing system ATP-binding protein